MVRRGSKLIVVDYLTLIQHGDARMPQHERVGEVPKALKRLPPELNIPIIALSRLARKAEGKEPNLAELRQSGEIEEDADCAIVSMERVGIARVPAGVGAAGQRHVSSKTRAPLRRPRPRRCRPVRQSRRDSACTGADRWRLPSTR